MTEVSSKPPGETVDLPAHAAGRTTRAPVTRSEIALIAMITGVFLLFGATMIARGVPLGHDESVYALHAHQFAGEKIGSDHWAPYRAPGLPALMSLPARITDGDAAMRAMPLLLAGGLILLTWVWGRYWFGPAVGLTGAAILAMTPGFATWAWQIGVDVPGAAWAMSAALVFLFASRDERVQAWGLFAIPLAMAAAYTRFGAPVLVAALMTAVALAHWRAVRRSPWMTTAIAAGTAAAMGAVLLVPAFTGSTVAPARAFEARQVAKDLPFWNSYADFWTIAPDVLGRWMGLVIGVGVLGLAYAVARKRLPMRPAAATLGALLLFLAGLGYGLAQGFVQYLLPAVPLAAVLGAAGLVFMLGRLPVAAMTVVLAGVVLSAAPVARAAADESARSLRSGFGVLRAASIQVEDRTEGDCVILTAYTPQVGWYSRCDAIRFANRITDPPAGTTYDEISEWIQVWYDNNVRDRVGADPVFLMLAKNGKRQPEGASAQIFAGLTDGVAFETGNPDGGTLDHIVVYRFVPPS